jgi:hypothetical protein
MNDLIDSILSMKMDVYRQKEDQDSYTGAIKRQWMYYKTIDCHAKGVISNSATTRSSDKQVFDNRYINDQMIQVRTVEKITAKEKVTNIRNADGVQIWTELNFPEETPTVFEVVGTTPLTDPFGRTLGYNSSLKRSENQGIGL